MKSLKEEIKVDSIVSIETAVRVSFLDETIKSWEKYANSADSSEKNVDLVSFIKKLKYIMDNRTD